MAFSKHQAEKIAQIWPSQSFSSGYFYSVMPQKHIEDFWNKTISVHLETSYTRKQYEWLWICIQKSSGSVSIYYWLCCGFLITQTNGLSFLSFSFIFTIIYILQGCREEHRDGSFSWDVNYFLEMRGTWKEGPYWGKTLLGNEE